MSLLWIGAVAPVLATPLPGVVAACLIVLAHVVRTRR